MTGSSASPPDEAPALDWSPAAPAGDVFPTHRLVAPTSTRLELRPTVHARRAVGVLVVLVVMFGGLSIGAARAGEWWPAVFLLGMTLVFATITRFQVRRHFHQRIFDIRLGRYWTARTPEERDRPTADVVSLAEIRGLQITDEEVDGGEVNFTAYELNLVLADGRRVNVVDHVRLRQIRDEAARIGALLGKPVWEKPGLGR